MIGGVKYCQKYGSKNVSVQFKSLLTAVAVQGTTCSNSSTISKEPKIAKTRHAIPRVLRPRQNFQIECVFEGCVFTITIPSNFPIHRPQTKNKGT